MSVHTGAYGHLGIKDGLKTFGPGNQMLLLRSTNLNQNVSTKLMNALLLLFQSNILLEQYVIKYQNNIIEVSIINIDNILLV